MSDKTPAGSGPSRNNGQGGNRYSVLDCFSQRDIGRAVTISLVNGRIESGILREVGMFDIKLELPTRKDLIVFKHGILTVSVM